MWRILMTRSLPGRPMSLKNPSKLIFSKYLSSESASTSQTEAEIRERILRSALANVPLLGWTDDAVAKAMKDVGYDSLSHTMIANGPLELVTYFMDMKRDHVSKKLSEKYSLVGIDDDGVQTNTDEVVYDAIEMHLDYIAPYLSSWPKALALLAEPSQFPSTLQLMTETADDICHYAGMKASRMDWYSDRGLVLLVFCSTELFMLTDYSENMVDTREFLKRNVGFYQKVKMNPTLSFLVESMLSSVLSELRDIANKGVGACGSYSNNNHNDSHNNNSNNDNKNNREHQ